MAVFSLLLAIKDGGGSADDVTLSPAAAQRIHARLDELTVELEELPSSRVSSLSSLHRMRSVESLLSSASTDDVASSTGYASSPLSSPISSSASTFASSPPLPSVEGTSLSSSSSSSRGQFLRDNLVVIQIRALVDSEASFSRARAKLKFSIFEDRPDETLSTFVRQKKLGASLIRGLLQEGERGGDLAGGRTDLVTDLVAEVGLTIPVCRPFEAALRLARILDTDPVLASSTLLVGGSVARERFRLKGLTMTVGDADARVQQRRTRELDSQVLRVVPLAVPTGCILAPGSTYTCIHQIDLMPFAEQHLHGTELTTRMDVTVALLNEQGEEEEEQSELVVSFEKTFSFRELLPNRLSPHGLCIILTGKL